MIRDRRRIDPTSGAVRQPVDEAPPAGAESTPTAEPAASAASAELAVEVAALQAALAERTGDLQRVSAEYANYRRRVDRDRALVVETAQDQVLTALLPVLDDIDRAREHGDLTGAFKAVADALETALARTGLEPFGAAGDEFDPSRHEAVMHQPGGGELTAPTCVAVMRRGYQRGDRVLRPAMVAVSEPEGPPRGNESAAGVDPVDPVNGNGPRDAETT